MLDNHKQALRPYCQNRMRSILQSIGYVEDSQKLLKGRLVKPRRPVLGLTSTSTFQEELLDPQYDRYLLTCRDILEYLNLKLHW